MEPFLLVSGAAVVVVVAVVIVRMYNGFVQHRLRTDGAWAQIDVQLKRRHDLVPDLVAAVRGYMGFEQAVLTRVTAARANAVAAGAAVQPRPQRLRAPSPAPCGPSSRSSRTIPT